MDEEAIRPDPHATRLLGIATYRGTSDSLWSNPVSFLLYLREPTFISPCLKDVVKYSSQETFKDDASGSWQFYHHRRLR